LKLLDRAIALYPSSVELKVKVIRCLFSLGQMDVAHQFIRAILAQDSEDYYGLLLLSEYFLINGDYDMASSVLTRVSRQFPTSSVVNYYLGAVHLFRNNTNLSLVYLQKSLQNLPSFVDAHILLSLIYITQKKYNLSSQHARAVLSLDPGHINAHLINGVSLYMLNLYKLANYEFDVIGSLERNNTIPHIFKTLISIETHMIDDIRTEPVKFNENFIEKLFLNLEMRKIAGTDRKDGKILDYNSNGEKNYLKSMMLGNYYRETKNYTAAKNAYEMASAAGEKQIIPYYYLGYLEALSQNAMAAEMYFRKVIEIKPSFVKSYQALGILYEQQRDYDSAKKIYEQGLRAAPDDGLLLNNLAWLELVYFSDKPAAYIHATKAARLYPEDPDIQDTLAWWYYLNGGYQEAATRLQRLVEGYPNNALYRYHLGLAYHRVGEPRQASAHLRKAIELGLAPDYQTEILELVK
jgi:tetratricopeptide (TPR) repeat protein